MGGKTQKVTETKTLPPWVDSAYQNLFGRANNVSQQPYQSYGKPRVAPWSPMSTRGLKLVEGLPEVGRESMDYGENYLKGLTGPGGMIDRAGASMSDRVTGLTDEYMNPWTSSVVDASLADSYQADASAQNDLLGRAISSGSNPFGGDRAGVAAASLAGEQSRARNSMVAGLRHTGYDSARNAAIQALGMDRNAAAAASGLGLQAAQGFGDFSNSRFNQASQAAKAHLEGGALQQQHNQNVIDADYQDFTEGRDWERNMVDWLSQVYGRGEYGGTTERTEPGPSPLNAILGLATAVLPMLLDKSGKGGTNASGSNWGVGSFGSGRITAPSIGGYATSPTGGQMQYYADGGVVDAEKIDDVWTIPVEREGEILVPPRPESLRRDREVVSAGIAPPRRRPSGPDDRETGAEGRPDGSRSSRGLAGRFAKIGQEPWRAGIMAGGLRMAASESPFPLQALGEGLSAGFATALERRSAMDAAAAEAARFEREQGRLDSQFGQNLALQREQMAMQRELAEAQLDANAVVLDDSDTYRVLYPSTGRVVDTGIPIVRSAGSGPSVQMIPAEDNSGAEVAAIVNSDGTYTQVGGIKPPNEGRKTENERQIDQLMARGFPRSDAEDIANGYVVVNTDPITGGVTLINKVDGTQRPVDYQLAPETAVAGDAPAATPREGEIVAPRVAKPAVTAPGDPNVDPDPTRQPIERTLWERAPNSTGIGNTINQVVTDVLPQILPGEQPPSSVIRPDVVEDRQAFSTATNDLIRALSINPRFPAAEMERIAREINILPRAGVGVEGLQARMRAVDEMLRNTLKNQQAAAADVNLPASDRQAALSNVNAIENFLNILGVPPPDDPTLEELAPGIRRARTR